MLIVFEGIDASGKTTLSNLVKEYLLKKGFKVKMFSYPNYASIYGSIIKLFLESKIDLAYQELFFLYILDMFREKQEVREAIASGNIVLIDRYYTSTIAYQCSLGFNYEIAKKIIEYLDMPKPNIIIYLDVEPKIAIERKIKQKVPDVFERNMEFLGNVRRMYWKLINEGYPIKNWIVVDASKNIDEVFNIVIKALNI
ncbi:dTMP kinase [Ignisphaera sp. 4213-co]|uniref:Probable thymidylate kinase n=1 Tax=Ignisphaera cupida TaxID=3050454 RepID=A0ABD4Z898_9CREN|nr:dTMP kinase [Ignisphaera sp. 4213-co]MDK6028328.1 dTMP kinase [Ignisphaera sp. 4213-co]